MKIDMLAIAFAFFIGSLLGYMVGRPQQCHYEPSTYSAPIQDTLPTMGQE